MCHIKYDLRFIKRLVFPFLLFFSKEPCFGEQASFYLLQRRLDAVCPHKTLYLGFMTSTKEVFPTQKKKKKKSLVLA